MSAAISRTVSVAGMTLAAVLIEEGPFRRGDSDTAVRNNCCPLTYTNPSTRRSFSPFPCATTRS